MARDNLKSLTTREILTELRQQLASNAQSLRRIMELLVELEDRGEPITFASGIPGFAYRRELATGAISADVFVYCAGKPALIAAVLRIVPEDQAKVLAALAKHGPAAAVDVVVGARVVRREILALTGAEIAQVFGNDRMRNPAEQRKYLRTLPAPAEPRPPSTIRLTFALTAEQHAALLCYAREQGCNLQEAVMMALRTAGAVPA